MNFKHMSHAELNALRNQQSINIVDIRDPMSFNMGHIPNARLIDNSNVRNFIANADKQQPLVVCCYHGNSSQSAAEFFFQQGFVDVYSLDGGFEYWQAYFPDAIERT